MSVRSALLALLSQGPRHGYQLKAEFDVATGEAWPLNFGQVYQTLQRLERDGLVSAVGEPDDDGRVAYVLTAEGQQNVRTWLESPVAQPHATRDEASLKLLLAIATGAQDYFEVIMTQRAAVMANLQALTGMKAEPRDPDDPASIAWGLHVDRMAILAEAEIRWLNLTEERLRSEPPKTLAQAGVSEPAGSANTSKDRRPASRTQVPGDQ